MTAMNEIWGKTFKKTGEIASRSIAGETLLVPIRGKLADMQRIFALNSVAEYIWKRLDGGKPLGEIRNEVLSHFEVGREEAENDIQTFISDLMKENLITEN
jgi:hypothetical protein